MVDAVARCESCKAPLPADVQFCPHCGGKQRGTKAIPRGACRLCGWNPALPTSYCGRCGALLARATAAKVFLWIFTLLSFGCALASAVSVCIDLAQNPYHKDEFPLATVLFDAGWVGMLLPAWALFRWKFRRPPFLLLPACYLILISAGLSMVCLVRCNSGDYFALHLTNLLGGGLLAFGGIVLLMQGKLLWQRTLSAIPPS